MEAREKLFSSLIKLAYVASRLCLLKGDFFLPIPEASGIEGGIEELGNARHSFLPFFWRSEKTPYDIRQI